jgi:hypothetical protein
MQMVDLQNGPGHAVSANRTDLLAFDTFVPLFQQGLSAEHELIPVFCNTAARSFQRALVSIIMTHIIQLNWVVMLLSRSYFPSYSGYESSIGVNSL